MSAQLTDDEFALLREADEAGVRALATFNQHAITAARMRLIATVERIVADRERAAWDKGYTSGHSNAMRRMSDEPNVQKTPNPYGESRHEYPAG